jgi:hypothetical protein
MSRHISISFVLSLIGLSAGPLSVVHGVEAFELEQRVKAHINERMYESCKAVVLAREADGVYQGYAEFMNGKRSALRVTVSGRSIEYAFVRPAQVPAPRSQSGAEDIARLRTKLGELEALSDRQEAEIARLKGLCRQAGIDPEPPQPSLPGEPPSDAPDLAEAPVGDAVPMPEGSAVAVSTAYPTFTSRAYSRIQKGMTRAQVVARLGADGDRISSSYFNDATNEVYVWTNPDDSHVCVIFQDGVVLVKTQFGLPGIAPAPAPPVTPNHTIETGQFSTWQLARDLDGRLVPLGLSFGQWLERTYDGLLKKSVGEPAQVDVVEEDDQIIVNLTREDADNITTHISFFLQCLLPETAGFDRPENMEVEKLCIPSRMRVNDKESDSPTQTWQAMATLADLPRPGLPK